MWALSDRHVNVLGRRAAWPTSDRSPPHVVRKTLFTLHLWFPGRLRARQQRTTFVQHWPTSVLTASCPLRRSADSPGSVAIGCLNADSLRNKTDDVNLAITERSLDVLALTETWHTASDDNCLWLATPSDYAVVDVARLFRRGGGIIIIFCRHWKCAKLSTPTCSTFKVLAVRLTTDRGPFVIVTVYRPGSDHSRTQFFDELSTLLEMLVVYVCPVLVSGDSNIKMQSSNDSSAHCLADLLTSFDMVQHVQGPTQHRGNTLDVIVTPVHCALDSVDIEPFSMLSDHSLRKVEGVRSDTVVYLRHQFWLLQHRRWRHSGRARRLRYGELSWRHQSCPARWTRCRHSWCAGTSTYFCPTSPGW